MTPESKPIELCTVSGNSSQDETDASVSACLQREVEQIRLRLDASELAGAARPADFSLSAEKPFGKATIYAQEPRKFSFMTPDFSISKSGSDPVSEAVHAEVLRSTGRYVHDLVPGHNLKFETQRPRFQFDLTKDLRSNEPYARAPLDSMSGSTNRDLRRWLDERITFDIGSKSMPLELSLNTRRCGIRAKLGICFRTQIN